MAGKETKERTLILGIDASKAKAGSKSYQSAVKAAGVETSRFGKAVTATDRKLGGMGKTAGQVKTALMGMVSGLALVAAARGAVTTVASFEETMAQVGAVTARAGESVEGAQARIAGLASAAERAGATTRFSATQAGEALLCLGRAGFDAGEATSALPATLSLAAAGAMDLGTAADIASNAVSQFNLDAADTARVSDVLITTSNRANTSVIQLGEAMKFAGPIASKLNVSLEETSAAAGVLGDAGIQASLAGTNLRGILVRLLRPVGEVGTAIESLGLSLDDVNPEKVGLIGAFRAFRDAQLDASTAAVIFGRLNVSAGLQLASNVDKLEELTEANTKSTGAAQRQASVVENTLGGALRRFKAATEAAAIATGRRGLSGALQEVIDTSAGVVRVLFDVSTAADAADSKVQTLAGAVEGLGLALLVLGGSKVASGVLKVLGSTRAVATAAIATATAQRAAHATTIMMGQGHTFLAARTAATAAKMGILRKVTIGLFAIISKHPVGMLITAIGLAGTAMGFFGTKTREATRAVVEQTETWDQYQKAVSRMEEVKKVLDLSAPLNKAGAEVSGLQRELMALEDVFLSFSKAVEAGDFSEGRLFGPVMLENLGFTKKEMRDLGITSDANNQKMLTAQQVIDALAAKYRTLEGNLHNAVEEQNKFDSSLRNTESSAGKTTKSIDEYVQKLKEEAFASTLSSKGAAKYRAALELLHLAHEEGSTLTAQHIRDAYAAIDANKDLTDEAGKQTTKLAETLKAHDFSRDISQAFATGFTNVITSASTARDALQNIMQSISHTILSSGLQNFFGSMFQKPAVTAPTAGGNATGFAAFFGRLFQSHSGNVFGTGNRKLFNGGYVQRTMTELPIHQTGDSTSIAERGPEAVLQLRRDAKGVLGVRMPENMKPSLTIQQHLTIKTENPEQMRKSRRQINRFMDDANRRARGAYGAIVS